MMEVIGLAAISLDGCITQHDSEGTAFTSPEDKQFFQDILKTFDCCVFGSKTFEISREAILKNLNHERLRIVLTSRPAAFSRYERKDALEFKHNTLSEIIEELQQRGNTRCAILGGTRLYTEAIQHHVLHELWLTLEPLAFGTGKRLFGRQIDARFSLKSLEHLSQDTLLLKYSIVL